MPRALVRSGRVEEGGPVKVRRVWECDCGETLIVSPVTNPHKIIVKGDGFHLGNHDDVQYIACRACTRRFELVPRIAQANELKKVWQCGCGHTKLTRSSSGDLVIVGLGYKYGSPITHICCYTCGEKHRIAPDLQWYSHLKAKAEKRDDSRANRRAKKRRKRNR